MALTSDGFFVAITVIDAGGNTTTKRYDMQSSTIGAAQTDAAAAVAAFQALTDSVVVSYNVGELYVEDALTLPASAEVHDRANIVLELTGKPTQSGLDSIPAPAIALFAAASGQNRNVVDVTQADLVAFYDLFAPTTGTLTISDGDTVASIRRGYRAARGVRRN